MIARHFARLGVVCALLLGATSLGHAQQPAASASPGVPQASATPSATPESSATAEPPEPKVTWSSVHVNAPYIAMTFDDGPSATLTPKLLDILAERHMHVTFFVVGTNAAAHPEILKRAVAEGHEIGNHSWDHPDFARKSEEEVRSQLNRTRDAIVAALGKPPTLFRPPYGSLTKEQRKWINRDYGYQIILWSVDPLDWRRPGPEIIHQRIVAATRAGGIILSHDIHPGTVQAMPATFDDLLGKGFKFVTVSELLAMDVPPTPKPGPKAEPGAAAGAPDREHPAAKPAPTPRLPEKITGAAD